MAAKRIGLREVRALGPGEEIWDGAVAGFGARRQKGEAVSYVLLYRTRDGRKRRYTIGRHGSPWTPDSAREEACRLLGEIVKGADPAADKREAREAMTVAELCGEYLEAARGGLVVTRFRRPKRPTTVAIDEGRVLRHIVPLIGTIPARDLKRAEVQRMADAIAKGKTAGVFKGKTEGTKSRGRAVVTGGAGTAARVVELLGGIWSWAEKRELVSGPNPAHGVETARGEAKDRVLSADELLALGGALAAAEAAIPMAAAAVRLIALSGLRREEACALRWSEIDPAGCCLRLETTKTGRSMRPIGKPARDLLESLPRLSDEWVFPNRGGTGRADLKASIATLFNAAGLTDARSHDLRRTYGSLAAEEGYGDATIAELLGHSRRGVTHRHYIRRPDTALVAAADRVARRIAGAMGAAEESAAVVQLRATR